MNALTALAWLPLALPGGQETEPAPERPPAPVRFSVRVLGNLRTPGCVFPEQAVAINAKGECAGSICRKELARAAFWSEDGTLTLVDTSTEGPDSFATALNDEGLVVGYSVAGYAFEAFRWEPGGERLPLGLPPGLLPLAIAPDATVAWSSAHGPVVLAGTWREGADPTPIEGLEGDVLVRDINAHGVVTGVAGGGELPARAFRWSPEAGAVTLPTPDGFLHGQGNGIDGAGVVVGLSRGERGERATRWGLDAGPELLPLADEENGQSVAFALNDEGWIVGAEYAAPDTFERATAVLWIGGVAYPLDSLIEQPRGGGRVHVLVAFDINQQGQIAARGRLGNQVRAIRLDPK